MNHLKINLSVTLAFLLPALGFAADKLSVTASNPLPIARTTITLVCAARSLFSTFASISAPCSVKT